MQKHVYTIYHEQFLAKTDAAESFPRLRASFDARRREKLPPGGADLSRSRWSSTALLMFTEILSPIFSSLWRHWTYTGLQFAVAKCGLRSCRATDLD